MFGDRHRTVEAFDSDETIRPTDVVARNRLDPVEWVAEQDQIPIQSHGATTWQLIINFGNAIHKMLAKLLTCQYTY
jgi:hypothetical protein